MPAVGARGAARCRRRRRRGPARERTARRRRRTRGAGGDRRGRDRGSATRTMWRTRVDALVPLDAAEPIVRVTRLLLDVLYAARRSAWRTRLLDVCRALSATTLDSESDTVLLHAIVRLREAEILLETDDDEGTLRALLDARLQGSRAAAPWIVGECDSLIGLISAVQGRLDVCDTMFPPVVDDKSAPDGSDTRRLALAVRRPARPGAVRPGPAGRGHAVVAGALRGARRVGRGGPPARAHRRRAPRDRHAVELGPARAYRARGRSTTRPWTRPSTRSRRRGCCSSATGTRRSSTCWGGSPTGAISRRRCGRGIEALTLVAVAADGAGDSDARAVGVAAGARSRRAG